MLTYLLFLVFVGLALGATAVLIIEVVDMLMKGLRK